MLWVYYVKHQGVRVPHRLPKRIAQAGDTYRVVYSFTPLSGRSFLRGEDIQVLERTQDNPYDYLSELGNLKVQHRGHTSVWSSFDDLIAGGWIQLMEVQQCGACQRPFTPYVRRFGDLCGDCVSKTP